MDEKELNEKLSSSLRQTLGHEQPAPAAEEKQEEVVEEKQEVVEETPKEEVPSEEPKEDRPAINYKREIERKTRELEKLRQELDAAKQAPKQRDPNDLSTWSEHELKAVVKSNDPALSPYKDQAEEILLDRKIAAIRERERVQDKRVASEMELRKSFPDALDLSSDFALRMEEVMQQLDLQKSPSGRLAAAKIVAGEMGKGAQKANDIERKKESSRIADVKKQMVDGDRSKPADSAISPKKAQELEDRIRKGDARAVGEALKARGMSYESFFKK